LPIFLDIGIYAHAGVSQFGKILTHSCTIFWISCTEIENSRLLYDINLGGWDKYIDSAM